MNTATDNELLRQFARTHAEDAFAELVRRHVPLVYSAALRQASGDTHRARDVVQTVFADFARKAATLVHRDSLTGWLYTSAHFAAANILRAENRRREREENFMRDPATARETSVPPASAETGDADADWKAIRPALDAAMHELNAADREAVLLRYFENRPFAEVGARLGLGENAARMRAERALDKLRARFARPGITTSGALAATLSAHAVQTAPAGLAAALPAASLAAAGTSALTKIMIASKIKLALGALVAAGAATLIVAQHQNQARLRAENAALQQQIAQLQTDAKHLAANEVSKPPEEPSDELLKLRGEVGQLKNQISASQMESRQLKSSFDDLLKQSLENFPALTNVIAFKKHQISLVKAGKQIGLAMRMYAADNNDVFPTNFSQIYDPDLGKGYLKGTNFDGNISLNDFQMVNEDWFGNLPSEAIPVAGEQRPVWWGGQWQRIYVFSDGSVRSVSLDDGNFADWEKQQLQEAVKAAGK